MDVVCIGLTMYVNSVIFCSSVRIRQNAYRGQPDCMEGRAAVLNAATLSQVGPLKRCEDALSVTRRTGGQTTQNKLIYGQNGTQNPT